MKAGGMPCGTTDVQRHVFCVVTSAIEGGEGPEGDAPEGTASVRLAKPRCR